MPGARCQVLACSSQRLAITTSGPPHHFAIASSLLGGVRAICVAPARASPPPNLGTNGIFVTVLNLMWDFFFPAVLLFRTLSILNFLLLSEGNSYRLYHRYKKKTTTQIRNKLRNKHNIADFSSCCFFFFLTLYRIAVK